jgi:hypothetical protein
MKITIEWDGVEERAEAQHALDGSKYALVLFEIEQHLRNVVKYGASISLNEQVSTESERDACEKVRTIIRQIVEDNGLTWAQIEQ